MQMARRWLLAALASTAAVGLVPAAAQAGPGHVTGLSEQHLAQWSPAALEFVPHMGGRFSQVRLQVRWDVALAPGSTAFNETNAWIAKANELGKQVLVSFYSNGGSPPAASSLRNAFRAFRGAWPSVTEFTAWNEPNLNDGNANPSGNAALAAEYWIQLSQECGGACTVAAGDFLDGTQTGTYMRQYKAYLDARGAVPAVWAIHPYSAMNSNITTAYNVFLTMTGNKPVWLTESGAYYCVDHEFYGPGTQRIAGQRLVDLMQNPRVDRTYYYHLRGSATEGTCGGGGSEGNWDTGLLDPSDNPRPVYELLYGAVSQPSASTAGASNVGARQATLHGTVDPRQFPTTYRFEYGQTTGYGNTAPASPASAGSGSGSVAVSESLTGLQPKRTYHYRLVASSRWGTSYGADQTFTTPRAQPSFNGDAKADLIVESSALNGYAVSPSTGASLGGPGVQTWLNGWTPVEWKGIGDFNGDDKTDLVVGSTALDGYAVSLSDGSRLGAAGSQMWQAGWMGARWRGVGDFNGDSKDDLIVASEALIGWAVALSDGSRFGAPGSQEWLDGWVYPDWADVGDFNGDGYDDLLLADDSRTTYYVALSDGTRLGSPQPWLTTWTTDPEYGGVGDFNGDGKDDVILGTSTVDGYAVAVSNGSSFAAPGTGSGLWLTGWTLEPEWADVADFNGDRKDDLILGTSTVRGFAVSLSDGAQLNAPGTGVWLTNWGWDPEWGAAG